MFPELTKLCMKNNGTGTPSDDGSVTDLDSLVETQTTPFEDAINMVDRLFQFDEPDGMGLRNQPAFSGASFQFEEQCCQLGCHGPCRANLPDRCGDVQNRCRGSIQSVQSFNGGLQQMQQRAKAKSAGGATTPEADNANNADNAESTALVAKVPSLCPPPDTSFFCATFP